MVLFRIAEYLLRMPEQFEVRVVSRHEGSAHKMFASQLPMIYPASAYPQLPMYERARRVLADWLPDLVYANGAESYEYCVAATALGIPSIHHVHELEGGFNSLVHTHDFSVKEGRSLFKECADLFICPCQETEDLLLRRYGVEGSKIQIVHEFIDPDHVRQEARSGHAAFRSAGPMVVGCGTASWRKGVDLFLRTAAKMPDVFFVWIGEFSDPDVRIGALANVRFVGELLNPFPQMAAGDVFFLPSREDPFPLVALEAMALGLPVVAWRKGGGIHAAIQGCGTAVDEPTPNLFERAIRGFLDDPAKKDRAGKTGAERVQSRYSARTNLPRILGLIQRASDGTSKRGGDDANRHSALMKIHEAALWKKKLGHKALRAAKRALSPPVKRVLKRILFSATYPKAS